MSDPYKYEFDDGYNYDAAYSDFGAGDQATVYPSTTETSLPAPPPVRGSTTTAPTPSGASTAKATPKRKALSSKKRPPKTRELDGFLAKKIACITIGNLPFPIINPNYFTYIRWSGRWIIVPMAFFEPLLAFFVLLFNTLSQWFLLGSSLEAKANIYAFAALRIILSYVLLIIIPLIAFLKYVIIYKTCTTQNLLIRAPLYIAFIVLAAISVIFYLLMWLGGLSSGVLTTITFLVMGIAAQWGIFSFIAAFFDVFVSIGWVILFLFSVIEIVGMVRNYMVHRKAMAEDREARNAV